MAKKKTTKKVAKQIDPAILEAGIRKFVKRNGGFRKGLTKVETKEAKRLLSLAGREKPTWDKSIDLGMINAATEIE